MLSIPRRLGVRNVSNALGFSPISSHTMIECHFLNESSIAFSTIEDNDKNEGVEGALVNSKAGPCQLDCISEA